MKITKKVREDAALICAVAASNRDCTCNYARAADDLGFDMSDAAFDLACAAWLAMFRADRRDNPGRPFNAFDTSRDAEAEALIRTGWTPGVTA